MRLLLNGPTIALLLMSSGSSGMSERASWTEQGGERCLDRVCGADEYCCNPTCGICAPLDGFCTDEVCYDEPCGDKLCSPREYCCNPSCGICAPIGGFCTDQVCHLEFSTQ